MRQEKSVYSFVIQEGEEDSAFRINEGRFKGTIYQYSDITLPEENNGNLRMAFKFDILDSAGHAREEYDDDWVNLIGDILADQLEEQLDAGRLQFN
jgi:hypothetical protein